MRDGWVKVSQRVAKHSDIDATIELVPAEPGRHGRHFIARVNGDWVYQGRRGGMIRWFKTFDDAAIVVEQVPA